MHPPNPSPADRDLHARAGLPVYLDSAAGAPVLRFGPGVHVPQKSPRRAGDLRRVLSPDTSVADPDETIYTVYRGIAPDPATAEEIERRGDSSATRTPGPKRRTGAPAALSR